MSLLKSKCDIISTKAIQSLKLYCILLNGWYSDVLYEDKTT